MLFVYQSLRRAAADLDAAVAGVGLLDPGACGELGGLSAAWVGFATAWESGIAALVGTQQDLAEGLRRVAFAARESDAQAVRAIWLVLE